VSTSRFTAVQELVGKTFPFPDYYEVGREKVREFARAIRNDHPAHHNEQAAAEYGYDGLIAPATFFSIIGAMAIKELFNKVVVGYDFSQLIQRDIQFTFHRPLKAGDQLHYVVTVESVRQVAGVDMLTVGCRVVDQHDQPLQTLRTTLIAQSDGEANEQLLATAQAVMMHSDE
jgi:acyl dehydratase